MNWVFAVAAAWAWYACTFACAPGKEAAGPKAGETTTTQASKILDDEAAHEQMKPATSDVVR